MDENAILVAIRQDVEVYDFDLDFRHIASHAAEGEFDEDDIVLTVMSGEIIEPTPERNRWLFCGNVPTLRLKSGLRGRWLHVSVQYIEEDGTTIVTAYRPNVSEWQTERIRRR